MKKIIGWTIALAILGAVLALKGATVEPGRLTTGVLGGAFLGFCIGYLLFKSQQRSRK